MARLKKRSDGYYCAWYNGKQFLGKTETEAKKKRDNYKYECEHGIEQQEPITVFDLAEKWLPVAKAGVGKGTYNQYATIMEKMTGVIGDKLVSAVTPGDIKNVWKEYVGLSQSYISKGSTLYKSFFSYAMENGYCRQNPVIAPSAKPHKGSKGTHRCLTKEEIRLIETVPHRCQIGAIIMMKAGLRRGEMLALEKKDIHNGRIWVLNAVKFVNNRPVVGKTKNVSSERSVPLFAKISPYIKDIKKYILPDADGNLCSETAFNRAWQSYMHTLSVKAGHKISFRPHDCRHTFVTNCRDKGIDIHTVMAWCGHASERMILEIYDHLSEEREQSAIKAMNNNHRKTITLEQKKRLKAVKSMLSAV